VSLSRVRRSAGTAPFRGSEHRHDHLVEAGLPIPLDELKYWSVKHQEAYANPEAVLKRLHPERVKS
jgi:hypothetical protein